MKIKISLMQKLLGTFFIITLLIGIVGFLGIENSSQNNKVLNKIIDNNSIPNNYLIDAKLQLSLHSRSIYRLIIVKDLKEKENVINMGKNRIKSIEKQILLYKHTELSDDEKKFISRFDDSWKAYLFLTDRIIQVINNNRSDEAWNIIKNEYLTNFQTTEDILSEIIRLNQNYIENDRIDINKNHERKQIITTVIVIISKILSIILGVLLTLSITRPINRLTKITKSIIDMDKNIEKPDIKRNDEIGTLSMAFCLLIDSLKQNKYYEKQNIKMDKSIAKEIEDDLEKIRESE